MFTHFKFFFGGVAFDSFKINWTLKFCNQSLDSLSENDF